MARKTIQREMILRAVRHMHGHPTAEDVYQEVHREYPAISKATVYRNLHQLAQEGEIKPVLLPDSPERFDNKLRKHYHFQCKSCGRIFDVETKDLAGIDDAGLNNSVHRAYGFQVDEHDIIFKGICPQCREEAPAGGNPKDS